LPGRDCGACTVCCVDLAIDDPELVKPDEVACPHLSAGGCSIYARRPRACAGWFCGWRLINLSEAMRPDRCGVLLVPEMCHEPGYQKGGLRLVGVGGRIEPLLQDEVVDLAGRCVARGVPIFLSYGSGEHCKRTLINPQAEPAVGRGDRAAFVSVMADALRRMRDQVAAELGAEGEG
jgi:hypothetical protein